MAGRALVRHRGFVAGAALGFLLCLGLLVACSSARHSIPIEGDLAGRHLRTTADSEVARYYLEEYLTGKRRRPELDRRISGLERTAHAAPPDAEALRDIAARFSPDFAALFLANTLLKEDRNRRLQAAYQISLDRPPRESSEEPGPKDGASSPSAILFAPGWLYRSHPENGADFQAPRLLLRRRGFSTALIGTAENGSVEANAEAIARAVRAAGSRGRCLILVSASKSGAEVAPALGDLLSPAETSPVRSWINIGGVLRGTPLADRALAAPRRWLVGLALHGRCEGLASMTESVGRSRFARLRIPEHVLVVSLVAVPLSGDVTDRARSGYRSLRAYGPNDGLTLLAEAIMPGGVTVLEPGLDHFFRSGLIEDRTLSLLQAVLRELDSTPSPRG
jgi:hypothetical protein